MSERVTNPSRDSEGLASTEVRQSVSTSTSTPGLAVRWLGRVPYAEALALQMKAVEERVKGTGEDVLLLLEHPTVVTLGRSFREEHLLLSRESLADQGIEVHSVARGGDVTLHAPGQLVGYLVLDLRRRGEADLHAFVRRIEASLIEVLQTFGLEGCRVEGRTGVFMQPSEDGSRSGPDRKIASIGIGVRRWVTFHGFALNVTTQLGVFDSIVPCGLGDIEMTSIAQELGSGPLGLDRLVRVATKKAFADEFSEPG